MFGVMTAAAHTLAPLLLFSVSQCVFICPLIFHHYLKLAGVGGGGVDVDGNCVVAFLTFRSLSRLSRWEGVDK